MTISSTDRRAGPFISGGSFPFTFRVFAKTDIGVFIGTSQFEPDEVLVPEVDFTVVLNPDQETSPGGVVTLTGGRVLESPESLVMIGVLEPLQGTDLINQGGFYPEVIETSLDKAVVLIQQLTEIVARCLKVDPTKTVTTVEALLAQVQLQLDGALDAFDRFLAPAASDPLVRDDGGALQVGDQYLNTTTGEPRLYGTDGWFTPGGVGRSFYDIGAFVPSTLLSGEVLVEFPVPRDVIFREDLPGAAFKLRTPPSDVDATFTLRKNGAAFGTVVFAAPTGATTITVPETAFATGDYLSITHNHLSPPDIAGLAFTVRAELT